MWSQTIMERIDQRWLCNYHAPKGWIPLVEELAEKLAEVYPEYKITQIKEKFGGLRFYVSGMTEEGWKLIDEAERKSLTICEVCGKLGKIRKGGWWKTLCDEHDDTDP